MLSSGSLRLSPSVPQFSLWGHSPCRPGPAVSSLVEPKTTFLAIFHCCLAIATTGMQLRFHDPGALRALPVPGELGLKGTGTDLLPRPVSGGDGSFPTTRETRLPAAALGEGTPPHHHPQGRVAVPRLPRARVCSAGHLQWSHTCAHRALGTEWSRSLQNPPPASSRRARADRGWHGTRQSSQPERDCVGWAGMGRVCRQEQGRQAWARWGWGSWGASGGPDAAA